ncbi:hypothetical protein [Streptomyces sp. NPDC101178]|uniref:hypothetical protein n=1 Tax=Streptomyces sp. NPDC101178 TaxID=3366124 RepID=UPI003829E0ED
MYRRASSAPQMCWISRHNRSAEIPKSRVSWRRRNVVERCFHRLEQWRCLAARYDRRSDRYLAAVTLASTLIRLDT